MYVYTHMNKYQLKHIYMGFPTTCSYGYGLGFAFKYTLNLKVCMLEQLVSPAAGMPA
jgi:CO dehydrogenase/acetyl-CoA synthase delta subunit